MKTAVIYARYSSERQTEQSIEGQLRVCNDFAERNGYTIVDTYIDRAMTGTNDNRKSFQKLLKDSSKRIWDTVLVYKLDRFSRNKYEMAMHRKTLRDNGVRLVSAMENIPDTPEGIILESLLEGMAEYYSAELAQKVRRGLNENVQKGKYLGGRILYGYKVIDKHIHIDEEKAEVIRYIYQQYSVGTIVRDIRADLTRRGIYHLGKPFGINTLYNILQNEKYAGIFHYNGDIYTNIYPRIVPEELFDAVHKMVESNRYGSRSVDVVYLLREKVFCGYCGKPIGAETGTSKSGEVHRYYKCAGRKKNNGCMKENLKKDDLENIVIDTTISVLNTPENIELISNAIMARHDERLKSQNVLSILSAERVQIQQAIENLLTAIEKGVLTSSTKQRLEQLEEKLQTLELSIKIEQNKENERLTKEKIVQFLLTQIKKEPRIMLDTLVQKVVLYDDKIEIYYNYIYAPITTDTKKTPDGETRRAFMIIAEIIKVCETYNKRNEPNASVQLIPEWLG